MAKRTNNIRTLKGGKVVIKLTKPVRTILQSAIWWRLTHLGDTDELRSTILKEIQKQLQTDTERLKLLNYEYLCLFEDELVNEIPDTLQALIFATINPDLIPIELK